MDELLACTHDCQMKLELQASTDKILFLKDNWPEFEHPEKIAEMSVKNLQCFCCMMNVVCESVIKTGRICPKRELLRLAGLQQEILLALDL